MKGLFQQAIHFCNRFDRSDRLKLSGYLHRVSQLEGRQLDHQLSQPFFNDLARYLIKRFLLHRDKLLVFLHDPDVPL